MPGTRTLPAASSGLAVVDAAGQAGEAHSCPNCHQPLMVVNMILPSSADVTAVTTGPVRLPARR
ncbi:hypothetical protein [Actinomadura xylanilytica]|uniref:hypothetical protein n=1 Tax=Actinomadura xylanilytica TaxID=887459 RepID=UPI00255A96D6|nr:hypothetical protein [Actinomadura xylanilytica]MDL4771327.1 hypothetical protein [Actinomadura xylanilytica]